MSGSEKRNEESDVHLLVAYNQTAPPTGPKNIQVLSLGEENRQSSMHTVEQTSKMSNGKILAHVYSFREVCSKKLLTLTPRTLRFDPALILQ